MLPSMPVGEHQAQSLTSSQRWCPAAQGQTSMMGRKESCLLVAWHSHGCISAVTKGACAVLLIWGVLMRYRGDILSPRLT